jgi:hypothetical protein
LGAQTILTVYVKEVNKFVKEALEKENALFMLFNNLPNGTWPDPGAVVTKKRRPGPAKEPSAKRPVARTGTPGAGPSEPPVSGEHPCMAFRLFKDCFY